jgi:oligopeptide transport system ATP-binding protein
MKSTAFSEGASMKSDSLLQVRDLVVAYDDMPPAVDSISFDIHPGETLALVGESGSGKSTTAFALMGLQTGAANVRTSGQVCLRLKDGSTRQLLDLSKKELRRIRGSEVAMIFQEPMSSLNPVYTIGAQIVEAIRLHTPMGRADALREAISLLESLGVSDPASVVKRYPHELSGGMRQRVMIAIALSCKPRLLIADEPTTALDVTIQAQIIELLRELQKRTGMAMLFITHNLGVVAEIAHRTMVMYGGKVVESGPVADVFSQPRMPYTRALLRSLPNMYGEDRRLYTINGNVPNNSTRPSGCNFHPRCDASRKHLCDTREPTLERCGPDHLVSCLRWTEIEQDGLHEAV